MSRSLHTQKLNVRALRRLVRPFSNRREEADYLSGRKKEDVVEAPPRLEITRQRPLPGTQHPVTELDIRELLASLGPASTYGLKSIRLRQESAVRKEGILFGEYELSGHVHLYALPKSPWRLPFQLATEDSKAFERYGARIEADLGMGMMSVHWSAEGLRRFVLVEVLVHELGHHMLQQKTGKHSVIVCRRSDHERRADLHSQGGRAPFRIGSRTKID